MPKARLPGLPTMAALLLAATLPVLVIFNGPIPASYDVLKDFQPLIAALVALISAGGVLFGATLAYRAALKKVNLDREIHERDARRRQRGVLLRARFGVWALSQSAIEIRKLTGGPMPYELNIPRMKLRGGDGLEDAWTKLEEFPGKISRAFSAIKVEVLNYELTMSEFGEQDAVTVGVNSKEATSVRDLVDHTIQIERHCKIVFDALEQEIADH